MSASPAERTPGRTPNGGLGPVIRRPKNADPLVRPKDKKKRQQQQQQQRPQQPLNSNGISGHLPNGGKTLGPGQTQAIPQHSGRPNPPFSRQALPSALPRFSENSSSGFSSPLVAPCADYPLVLTKRALMEGYRHHVARFSSKRNVDPRNTNEFERPVRLHRRDPRAPPGGGGGVKGEDQVMGGMGGMDDKEKEQQEILKAERDAQREAEMALVAPSVPGSGAQKFGKFMKKTEQIYRNDQTDEQKAASKLRYEEALPWHLEDFDNKSTWVGSYEAALSDTHAMMVQGQDGVFRIVPLEKWYKFTQKNQFKTLSIEEAESRFNKKVKEPRWFMDSEESRMQRKNEQENKKATSGLFLGKWEKGGGGSGVAAPITKHENADADDLDFTEDRFADDEENMLFEEDDETKEAEERIKRDQLQANVFDLKEEKEYEKQEKLEKKEKEAEKKLGKGVKKALMKREKNYIYDSDSTDNPYSSESESDSTETERLKEEERKKTEDNTNTPTPEKDKLKSKHSSGASIKGTNTPSGLPSKHAGPLKHSPSSNKLKRPGSPLISEASDNESSRKKHKKKYPPTTSSQPQAPSSSTLKPPSRPTSPPLPSSSAQQQTASRHPSTVPFKRPRGSGSGSDTEGAAASGGEMSDGTRKRIKLKMGMPSKNGTPQGSRGVSPEAPVANNNNTTKSAQRAGSPASPPPTSIPPTTSTLPTAAELRARIPVAGISIAHLLGHFKGSIRNDEEKTRFIRIMRANSQYDKESKLLRPLGS